MPDTGAASLPQPDELPADVDLTVTDTRAVEGQSTVRLIGVAGFILVLAGYLLPWFVSAYQTGFSPADVIFGFTGVGNVFIVLLTGALIFNAVMVGIDLSDRLRRRSTVRWVRLRTVVAAVGAGSTLAVVFLVSVLKVDLFGDPRSYRVIDNAVWMTLAGYVLIGLAYGARQLIARHPGVAFAVIAFVFGGLAPLIFGQATDFIGWGAKSAGVYILMSLGLNVVVGFAGLLDLGYAAFFAIGAYSAGSLAGSKYQLHIPLYVVLFLGAAIAGLFGAALGAPTLRLRGDYLAIVTLGFGEIVPIFAHNNFLNATNGPNGLDVDSLRLPSLGSLGQVGAHPEYSRFFFWVILILIAIVVVVLRNLEHSRLGRAWVAIREDEVAAAATGINPVSTKLLAFGIGATISGFAGVFFGAALGNVSPELFDISVSIFILTTVVLGGIGNIAGVAVGALLLSFIAYWVIPNFKEWSATLGRTTGVTFFQNIDLGTYTYILYGTILIGIMLLRPEGLLPNRARKVELTTGTESEALASVQGKA